MNIEKLEQRRQELQIKVKLTKVEHLELDLLERCSNFYNEQILQELPRNVSIDKLLKILSGIRSS